MARRKRASMREGPLADLFRSTTPPPREEPEAREPQPPYEEPTRVEPEETPPEETPAPDPERVRAYRVDEPVAYEPPPPARERLSRIFTDDARESGGPAYGREEPS